MREEKFSTGKVPQEQKVKDSSVTSSTTRAIIEKLSQNSSSEYKPYDSLRGRYVRLNIK